MTKTLSLEITPGTPASHGGITVFPLLSLEPVELPYVLPGEAIEAGGLEIREVSEGGSVPELLAINRGATAVLLLDGEQLIGAKQNRMASRTILLPPESRTIIPVSCIEQGRWRRKSDTFRPSAQYSPSKARKSVRTLEAMYAKRGVEAGAGHLREAQGRVWADVDAYSDALQAPSPTSALDEVYEAVGEGIESWTRRFACVPKQIGLIVFSGDRPLGLDVIGGRTLYARVHERLLRGYWLDALEARRERGRARRTGEGAGDADDADGADTPGVDEADALRFLDQVQRATRTQSPTVGAGAYHVLSETVVGAELVDGPRLAHRSAFEADDRD